MYLIRPSAEILSIMEGNRALNLIERAGRVCYKSEDAITEDSNLEFVRKIRDNGHHSVIEHSAMTVHFVCDRGVSHEIVRHRLASFCLSGDSKILRFNQSKNHLSIKELFTRQQDGQLRGRNSLMLLRSMNEDGKIVPNAFNQILYSGKKDMYRVSTALGYSIKASRDHLFFTPKGETRLKELNVGDEVFVNGTKLVQDIEWLTTQRDAGLHIQAIADKAGVGYSTVRKYIRLFGLAKPLGNKPTGFKPWNKGLSEEDDHRVKNQANALRKNHHNNGLGELNSNWNNSNNLTDSGLRLRFSEYPKITCECCGSNLNLENHHRDKDITNWRETNKMTLCAKCHKAYHCGYNVKHVLPDEIVAIQYAGMEDSYDIKMNKPFHNFVADGFVVHNSQESTRYCNYKGGVTFVIPPWLMFSEGEYNSIKQVLSGIAGVAWFCHMLRAEKTYKELLLADWSAQMARAVLPNSLKTEITVTANFREWLHIFKLRCSKAAHPQMREVMRPLRDKVRTIVPVIFEEG